MKSSAIVSLLCLCIACPCMGATVTVDVTIKSVELQTRGITVVYKTELGEKTIELDVGRKAEISVNGKEGTLDSLGAGLKAKVSFDKDLAIVTKIEATGVVVKRKPPELVEVSELNPGMYPWLTEDGLTVYWERSFSVWTAHRANVESYFSEKKELFPGRQPTLTADGLEMIFLGTGAIGGRGERFSVAKREDVQQPFNRAHEIVELAGEEGSRNLSLSPDGLSVYFNGVGGMVCCVRKTKESSWSKPKPIPVRGKEDFDYLAWPLVTNDGLMMFCCNDGAGKRAGNVGNLLVWCRGSLEHSFANPKVIELDGLPPLIGRSPRYVAATNELFFFRMSPKGSKAQVGGIWVVKNFTLPDEVKTKGR